MHAFDKLHEECGVFGIYLKDGKTGVVPAAYHALYALQHRGQESCGIAVNNDGVIDCYKDVGLVNEVFTRDVLEKLHEGSMAVGHCRYGTTGTQNRGNAQPMLVNHLKGDWPCAITATSSTLASCAKNWNSRARSSTPPATPR